MVPVQFSAMQCVQSLVYSIRTNCDWMGGIDKVRSEIDLSADGETHCCIVVYSNNKIFSSVGWTDPQTIATEE